MDSYKIIKYPLSTEKSIRLMESQNKLIFVVDIDADKKMIKTAIEDMFKAKVENIKTYVQGGEKRAYVKFSNANPAIDIATQLGLM
ncbi:MAG: 50S ribosomal protein L23 [Candidatus Woesearchaeota archaeon]|jgi:ribosomal protein L23|nr:50S ribosomal protein L23 [Candidatus Woesearchaeota archaeon]MDP6600167.1 50S ribosomal protein L23 [Candidatus Woesearchaeota archaeon]|tara:strand:- start:12816 stop:13073 length:258 start_codon:yes stop_codon:yes gene_type:complete